MLKNATLVWICAANIILTISFSSYAQVADEQALAELEVIEVVAQKRKQDSQKVGISLSVLSSHKLSDLGISNTVDITQQIPNFQFNAWSPNLTIFNLRGVSQNSFTDNLEAPIAVYLDEAYMGSLNGISGQLFDMQQVEVLRGPQGTLFGRNATGGLIQYISNLADEDYFNGYLKFEQGTYDHRIIQGAFGGSLSDSIRGRIAFSQEKSDGYIESATEDIRAVGGADNQAIKGVFQFDLAHQASLDLLVKYSKDDDVPTGGYSFLPWGQSEIDNGYIPPELISFTQNAILQGQAPPNGLSLLDFTKNVFFNTEDGFSPVDDAGLTLYRGDHSEPHQHYSNNQGFLQRETNSVTAIYNLDLDQGMHFESISNVNHLTKTYLEDGDGLASPIISFQTDMDYQQWSQEFRLSFDSELLNWQVGSYFLDMQHKGLSKTIGNPVLRLVNRLKQAQSLPDEYDPTLGAPESIQDYQISAFNWSLFSQIEYAIDNKFSVIAGLRFSQDIKDMSYQRGFRDLKLSVPFIVQGQVSKEDDTSNIDHQDYAAKLQLNWQIAPNSMLFTSYNRGIKVGNWAYSSGVPINQLKHKPETLHSFEIGAKSWLLQRTMSLNATGFYYDYQDYQAFSMLGLSPQISNTDAWVKGIELEAFWQITPTLEIALGAGFLDSEVEKVSAVGTWISPVGETVIDFPTDYLYNLDLPNTPDYSFNYVFRYTLPVLSQQLTVQLDGVYYDEQYLEVTNGGGAFQKAYGVTNLRLTYKQSNNGLEVALWMKNITDQTYKLYSLDLGMLGATAYYAQPATSGVTVTYRF